MVASARWILVMVLFVWAGGARAEVCALDDVPAATLLLPYFEVAVADPDGVSTLLSVVNTVGQSTLARVTLWTDLGLPTFGFDVYLTGFDVYTLNLRDLFVAGKLPETGDAVSPLGHLSLGHVEFPGCAGLPGGLAPLPPSLLTSLVAAHRGDPSSFFFNGLCGARRHGDGWVRGFLTVDVVRECSALRPGDPGYFGQDGVAAADNRLIGDYFVVDGFNNFAHGENLVRIEADPEHFGPGDKTFYGPFVDWSGADGREPLPATWGTRQLQQGSFFPITLLTVWRGLLEPMAPFACTTRPQLPLSTLVYEFDEEENVSLVFPNSGIVDPPLPLESLEPFPLAASEQDVTRFASTGPFFDLGWLYLDLHSQPVGNAVAPPEARSQAWVGSRIAALGRFSVGMNATPQSPACGEVGCGLGEAQPAGLVCVRGVPVSGRPEIEELLVGQRAQFDVYPAGCFSSSCTRVYQAECRVGATGAGGILPIRSRFCLGTTSEGACTADCGGGGSTACLSEPLAAGTYHATFGGFSLDFTVPSEIPRGGLCVDAGCPACVRPLE